MEEQKNSNNLLRNILIATAICCVINTAISVDMDIKLTNALKPTTSTSSSSKKADKNAISSIYKKLPSFEENLKKDKPVIVFFYTDWCGYCQRFQPIFDKVIKNDKIKEKFNFSAVNCEDQKNSKLMEEFQVGGFPTVYLVGKQGKEKIYVQNSELYVDEDGSSLVKKFVEHVEKGEL